MTARDLIAEASSDLRRDIHKAKLREERSEELANARSDEDCVYNVAHIEVYKLSCGCRFDSRLKQWEAECDTHTEEA